MSYLGIDFSGDARKWSRTVHTRTVWVAKVQQRASVKVDWVRAIQDFPGSETPFQRLANLLRRGDFIAAGIDAPFSIPIRNASQTAGNH